jgi:hypothetical protein
MSIENDLSNHLKKFNIFASFSKTINSSLTWFMEWPECFILLSFPNTRTHKNLCKYQVICVFIYSFNKNEEMHKKSAEAPIEERPHPQGRLRHNHAQINLGIMAA